MLNVLQTEFRSRPQFLDVARGKVDQLLVLAPVSQMLHRVQFWRIRRKVVQVQPRGFNYDAYGNTGGGDWFTGVNPVFGGMFYIAAGPGLYCALNRWYSPPRSFTSGVQRIPISGARGLHEQ